MTLTIGLTGGIGSGKSTVARLFSELGIAVFDTDSIAKELVSPGQPALQEIKSAFGNDYILESGDLNRDLVKQKIFENENLRQQLESILHPKIREQLQSAIASSESPYCIAVIPLLLEKNWQNDVDRVLVIDLPEEAQLTRTVSRDGISEALANKIMQTQVSRSKRLSQANDIIDNSGSLDQLAPQVNQLHNKYLELSKNH